MQGKDFENYWVFFGEGEGEGEPEGSSLGYTLLN